MRRLAPGQEREWEVMKALSPADPGRSRILVGGFVYLDGRVDERALMRAFASVIARHEALRLTLGSGGMDPCVHIAPTIDPPVEYVDLSGLSGDDQRVELERLAFREGRRCFDLWRGPLWKAHLVRLTSARHLLSVSFCHLIADGWSRNVFILDLLAGYAQLLGAGSRATGEAPTFDEISALQGARLASAGPRQPSWLDGITARESASPFTPTPASDLDLLGAAQVEFRIPSATASQLRQVAWKARSTPFVVLLTAYHVLLSLVTGRDRIVVNTTTLGRPTQRERQAILQFTVDTYVALDVQPDASLHALVQRASATVSEAVSNQVSFQAIARCVNPAFDVSRPWPDCYMCDGNFNSEAARRVAARRVVTAGVAVQAAPIAASAPPGHSPDVSWAELGDRERAVWAARGHPGVVIRAERDGGTVRYNGGLYPESTIRELIDRFLWVVEEMAWRPVRTVRELRDLYEREPAAAL
jgi:hypothetical protein